LQGAEAFAHSEPQQVLEDKWAMTRQYLRAHAGGIQDKHPAWWASWRRCWLTEPGEKRRRCAYRAAHLQGGLRRGSPGKAFRLRYMLPLLVPVLPLITLSDVWFVTICDSLTQSLGDPPAPGPGSFLTLFLRALLGVCTQQCSELL
jgi:hypothetical protein